MSILAITTAHLATMPVRYAVGRWYNIPTTTLLAYNAANIGISILASKIGAYAIPEWHFTYYQTITIGIVCRSCFALFALYLTSKLTDPMPTECAMMTSLASITFVFAMKSLEEWRQQKNE